LGIIVAGHSDLDLHFKKKAPAKYSAVLLIVETFKKKYKGGGTHRLTAYAAAALIIIG
jgi:hypothetical protein